uniref:CACTA en-spm transposon protein n=1 Tax=Heterorhabditis bacteriophora TaxID=37862 RepID=A0A1I7X2D5_HETBA
MRGFKIDPRYIDRFQRELFDFASSRLSMEDFDKSSSYSSADLRERQSRAQHNPTNSNDVVFLHDDSSIESSQDVDSSDLVVLDDEGDHLDEDEAISSGSEAEKEFYARPACRIEVADAFGYQFRVGLLNGLMVKYQQRNTSQNNCRIQSYTGGSSTRFYGDVQSNQLVPSVLSKTSKKDINAVRSTASRLSSFRPRPYTTESNDHASVLQCNFSFSFFYDNLKRRMLGKYILEHVSPYPSYDSCGNFLAAVSIDCKVISPSTNITGKNFHYFSFYWMNHLFSDERRDPHSSDKGYQQNEQNRGSEVNRVVINENNVFDEAIMNEDKTVGLDMKDFEVEEQLNNKIGDPGPVVSENVTAGKESVRNL